LHVIEAKVRKCFGEKVVLDKKMMEHRWRYRKYMILLEDDQPFENHESVKIICKSDFEEIRSMVKGLGDDKNHLKCQVEDLKMEVGEQEAFINYLKEISVEEENIKNRVKTRFKSLIP
jgi:DNA integrity scanning protein DisA with diadenylate cyclase activity